MIYCKEIDEYIKYCEENPQKINKDRKLLQGTMFFVTVIHITNVFNIVKNGITNCFHIKNSYMLSYLCIKMTFRYLKLLLY